MCDIKICKNYILSRLGLLSGANKYKGLPKKYCEPAKLVFLNPNPFVDQEGERKGGKESGQY